MEPAQNHLGKFRAFGFRPLRDLGFVASALSLGASFVKQTPQVDNVQIYGRTYDPGEPGESTFYLSPETPDGISLASLQETWATPDESMADAARFVEAWPSVEVAGKLERVTTQGQFADLAARLNLAIVGGIVASQRKLGLAELSAILTPEESAAAEELDKLPDRVTRAGSHEHLDDIKRRLVLAWKPGMVAWIKCWRANFVTIGGRTDEKRAELLATTGGEALLRFERQTKSFDLILPQNQTLIPNARRWMGPKVAHELTKTK